jgi:hypothetical protein
MSVRTFLFCDICNPMGIRLVEVRRTGERDTSEGRRLIDGRAWFEGSVEEAKAVRWAVTLDGRHVCPACATRHRKLVNTGDAVIAIG